MNSSINFNHKKIFGTLIALALLSAIVFVAAIFKAERAHAAETLVFANVAIEDGSMRPLALLDTSVSTDVKANVNNNVKADVKVDANANVNSSANTKASPTASPSPVANASVQNSTTAVIEIPANMNTTDDLNLYTKYLEEQDKNVSKVEINDNHIIVGYREPAKFLGFIPVSVTANAQVDADGKVTLHYPWYTFLSTKDDAQLRSDLQIKIAEIMGNRNGNVAASASTTVASNINENANFRAFTARARAEVIQALHEALRTSVKAEMHTQAEAQK